MALLDGLSPTQRTALFIGVPVVGVAVILTQRRSADPEPEDDTVGEEAAAPAGVIPGYTASTDAIGTGTLAQYTTLWSDALSGFSGRLEDLESRPTTTPPPATPPHTVRFTYVRTLAGGKGESALDLATRLRAAGQKTAAGDPITSTYLVRFNMWKGTPAQPRWPGTQVAY